VIFVHCDHGSRPHAVALSLSPITVKKNKRVNLFKWAISTAIVLRIVGWSLFWFAQGDAALWLQKSGSQRIGGCNPPLEVVLSLLNGQFICSGGYSGCSKCSVNTRNLRNKIKKSVLGYSLAVNGKNCRYLYCLLMQRIYFLTRPNDFYLSAQA